MSRFRYPVDTDQFQRIREDGKVYVDKTGMMYSLVNKYQYVFLARPRRFGKSLLCNTFKAYFQGKKAQLYGSIVTCQIPIVGKEDEFVQIDNIIVLTPEELNFQKSFLNLNAQLQTFDTALAISVPIYLFF